MHAQKQPEPAAGAPKARPPGPAAAPAAAPAPQDQLELQRQVGNAAVVQRMQRTDDPQPSTVYGVLRAPGRPLDEPVRGEMETRLGADFGDVRVHTGTAAQRSAEEIGARAYTAGSHVVLGREGGDRHTLAHELSHVVQQRRGPVEGTDRGDGLRISDPADRFERAAEAAAARAMAGRPAEPDTYQQDLAGRGGHRTTSTRLGAEAVVARMPLLDRLRSSATREAELSTRFGIRIGPSTERPDDHFSHAVLDRIEAALARLPIEQLRDNPDLVAIQPGTGEDGAASGYDAETQTINIVNPVRSGLLYSILNRRVDWQRRRMDRGAMAHYEGISNAGDRALGINPRDRQVMGGVSDALVQAQGNLIKWTIRHEVGHPVERQVDWAALSTEPRFGGWQTFVQPTELLELAGRILGHAGFSGAEQRTIEDDGGDRLSAALLTLLAADRTDKPLDGFVDRWATQDDEFRRRLTTAVGFVQAALAQPWTLPDGGASRLAIGPRVYHFSPGDTWVSYLEQQRTQHAVSNYQFSDPWEWFAEAYAAYNDPAANSGARNRLHPDARTWFANNLPAAFPAADQQAETG
jgi:hypothetical protein